MHNHLSSSGFQDELGEVQTTLQHAVDALGSPLGDIVRAQAKRAYPLVRAVVVLATAVSSQEEDTLRSRRISLAAALEMLYVALSVHRLLVGAAHDRNPTVAPADVLDRTFVGSTILSGDYCFSRAAQMAASTNNPHVIALFSQALQSVSEGLLRHQFDHAEDRGEGENPPGYDVTGTLLQSGVWGAAALAQISPEETSLLARLAQELAHRISHHKLTPLLDPDLMAALTLERRTRWQQLPTLLAVQPNNGRIQSSISSPSR